MVDITKLSPEEQAELLALLEAEEKYKQQNKLKFYKPYAKQKEFHAHSSTKRERGLLAGNQLGKTVSAGAEVAMHLTGQYPEWWTGRRYSRPTRWMAGSESAELTRKGVQRVLLGPPETKEQWGTGSIPADCIVDTTPRPGVPDAVAVINVRHVSGGISSIQLNSYDQGRSKWQAETVDGVWLDEEPPEDVYFEAITRTNVGGGLILLTMTPLKGMSSIVRRYLSEPSEDRVAVSMTIDDVDHYTAEEKAKIIASYPAHEREARTKGIPTLGSGRIFPVTEESISCAPFQIPDYWPQINGLDFGWDHPTAAVNLAWDRDSDCIYVTKTHKKSEQTPVFHAAAIKPWGVWIPVAWPHDGLQHDKGSGDQLAEQYRAQGLNMLGERATFEDGSNGVEAGLIEMLDRMQTGRFKVFSHLADWFDEFRLYHRKDGKVVKEFDDVLSATRYGMMMIRFAITKPRRTGLEKRGYGDSYAGY